jgi:DNA modification methylase
MIMEEIFEKVDFDHIEVDERWCFKNVRSTEQWTHGYHRYPAKFLPNIVKKLIEEYATGESMIADIFAGCGTTLVEAKVHGKPSIGVDINPVAKLITQVKIRPLLPMDLQIAYENLLSVFDTFNDTDFRYNETHERIDYWFRPLEKVKIAFLYKVISDIDETDFRDFFLVCLSNILKNCSRWLQSSTKPQIDPNKIPSEPFEAFKQHCKKMIKQNASYYKELHNKDFLNTSCQIKLQDARNTSLPSDTIGTIITSPPYVTSYEYADIHQLTGYWFEYIENLSLFRKEFIGTFYSNSQMTETTSTIGQEIIDDLVVKEKRKACEVANYFNDMYNVGKEMFRILKPGGYACIVIGNTMFKGVKIKSAEVFFEMLLDVGFSEEKIIKRSIPYKLIPAIRDKTTGKFTTLDNKNSKLVYPEEYILILKK